MNRPASTAMDTAIESMLLAIRTGQRPSVLAATRAALAKAVNAELAKLDELAA